MKTKFTLVTMLICAFFASNAQQAITNGSFETWTSPYAPTGWTSYEDIITPIQGAGLIEKDSVDKFSGNYSVKLTSKYVALASDTVGAAVAIGTGAFINNSPKIAGIPFTSSPDTLEFAYKYQPNGADSAGVEIQLHKAGTSTYKLQILDQLLATSGQWGVIAIPLKQLYSDTTGTADTLKLSFFSSAIMAAHSPQGSILHVDAVRFGYVVAPTLIEEINSNITTDLFPNPAKDRLHFSFSEAQNNASIMVFDMTGRVLTHEFVDGNSFDLNTSRWSTGMYTYSLISNGSTDKEEFWAEWYLVKKN